MARPRKKIDLEWIEELEITNELDRLQDSRLDREILMPLLAVEALGSWVAADAFGSFDVLPDDIVEDMWRRVPLSRGGGSQSMEAEIAWNSLIQSLTGDDPKVLTKMKELIDQRRREINGTG